MDRKIPNNVPKITEIEDTIKEFIKKIRLIIYLLTPMDFNKTISLNFSLIKKI